MKIVKKVKILKEVKSVEEVEIVKNVEIIEEVKIVKKSGNCKRSEKERWLVTFGLLLCFVQIESCPGRYSSEMRVLQVYAR